LIIINTFLKLIIRAPLFLRLVLHEVQETRQQQDLDVGEEAWISVIGVTLSLSNRGQLVEQTLDEKRVSPQLDVVVTEERSEQVIVSLDPEGTFGENGDVPLAETR
jgi:hypothetical protein